MFVYLKLGLVGLFIIYGYLFYKSENKQVEKFTQTFKYGILGFITNFFDFLGIGSYAPQMIVMKKDIEKNYFLPGTLTVANFLPVLLETIIGISIIKVEPLTLIILPLAASIGGYLGAKVTNAKNSRKINKVLIVVLLLSGIFLIANAFEVYPLNNIETNLYGLDDNPIKLLIVIVGFFILGILQSFGLGIYAPGFALLGVLGVSYIAILPINMLSSVCLSTTASFEFLSKKKYIKPIAATITIFGVLGVTFAAYISMQINLGNYLNGLKVLVAILVFINAYRLVKEEYIKKY